MKQAVVLMSVFFICLPATAAVVTVDVTIKTVNLQARGITVVYDSGSGQKTIELDVSRKAEITVNEKPGNLESLGPGLKAKVSYDRDLAVVMKIEAAGSVAPPAKPPESRSGNAVEVPVDLLALVVPQQHRILGSWEEQNGQLDATGKNEKNAFASCTIPFKATGSYLLHVEFTRLVGWPNDYAGPTFALPVGKAAAQFWLDIGPQQAHCGLSTTENDDVRFNKTGIKSVRLQNNTRYGIDIRTTVLPKGLARIEVALNGNPCYRWNGQQDELRVSPFWKYPSDGSFGLGVRGRAIFHKATFTPVQAARR